MDKYGSFIAMMITIANIHDRKGTYLLKELCLGIKVILVEVGYREELIENVKTKFVYIIWVVISAYKDQEFKPIHKRWIVEGTFWWIDNDRKPFLNCELTFESKRKL